MAYFKHRWELINKKQAKGMKIDPNTGVEKRYIRIVSWRSRPNMN